MVVVLLVQEKNEQMATKVWAFARFSMLVGSNLSQAARPNYQERAC